ncbi:MAG TPA: dTDP-4-amino-4,6-dideoxygalactose transaminase [Euzebyales bacterium]|nr:dTDP-4-amino-4,6-dideoxygalactose transaminase [Euzebyales bacterium]
MSGVRSTRRLTFNRPTLEGDELAYVRQAVEGGHTSSSGPFAARAAATLRDEIGAADVLLTTSCTAALEMSGLLLGLQPGDTVIVPSFTFVTTALAFVRAGARLVFADIEQHTLGIDPASVAELLDKRVRAVVAVHYAGVGCDLEGLGKVLSSAPDTDLIEDNAHGLFGRYRDRPLGGFGRFGTLSFHETKNFVCGEGGALLLNDPADIERAHVLYDKGTNRRAFMLGEVDKYSWKDTGSSFGLSDILAAYLLAQLEQRDRILSKRRVVFEQYDRLLAPLGPELGFRTPVVPADRDAAWHMYYVLLEDRATRDRVLDGMRAQDIHPTFHYVPLHTSDGGYRFAARLSDCPVTASVSGRLLRLPFHNALTAEDVDRVVETFLACLGP